MLLKSGTIESFEGALEKQALLGIHRCRLQFGDTEEGCVELGHVLLDKTCTVGIDAAEFSGIGVVEASVVEPLGWYLEVEVRLAYFFLNLESRHMNKGY